MLNRVILMGRLTASPELRQTPNNISTTSFTVAIDRPYQKDKEKQADFISCVAWRSTAEFINKYFEKGSMIIIEGALRTRTYEDKKGSKHYVTEVYVDNVQFRESNKRDNNSSTAPATQENTNAVGDLTEFEEILGDGQLPF